MIPDFDGGTPALAWETILHRVENLLVVALRQLEDAEMLAREPLRGEIAAASSFINAAMAQHRLLTTSEADGVSHDVFPVTLDDLVAAIRREVMMHEPLFRRARRHIRLGPGLSNALRGNGEHALLDRRLLRYALAAVLHNAICYSRLESETTIDLGFSHQTVDVTVSSVGIGLTPEQTSYATKRGWRGPEATAAEPSGAGIGLFAANIMMRSMGGSLSMRPTDPNGITVATLSIQRRTP